MPARIGGRRPGRRLGLAVQERWFKLGDWGGCGGGELALAKIVNLREARKSRERDEKQRKAAENRRAHGRTKAERRHEEKEQARARALLERHKLETDEEE